VALCLGPKVPFTGQRAPMNIQRLVSFVLVWSVMVCGILMGGPLTLFFDATSITLFMGVVGGGILWSHSPRNVLEAFGTVLSTGPVDAERSQRDHNTFIQLARLSSAVCWIGPIIGIIQILRQFEDPSAIGPGVAVIFLTILYGTAAGELVLRPAAAACLNQKRSSTEPSIGPISFHPRKLISVLLMGGLVTAGLGFSSPVQNFFDFTSMGMVTIATAIGLLLSHSASNVSQTLRSVFGPETMHPEHAEQGAAMFLRLAELAVATGFLGMLVGMTQMLQNLADPSAIGPALSVALLTMFYGVLLSELVFRPAATDCLKRGGIQAEGWFHRHPNRTVGILGPVLLVVFTWALMIMSLGL
jgi:flagellar motor component MotA